METTFIYLFVIGAVFIGSITIISIGFTILWVIECIEDFLKARREGKDSKKGKK